MQILYFFYIFATFNLNFYLMNLQIRVFSNQSAPDERVVSLPFGVKAPFDSLIDDFKFLFGDNCIVDFKVS